LLGGQGWFDLDPASVRPGARRGGNIHWSRLVDLPLAARILAKPLVAPRMRSGWRWPWRPAPLLLLMFSLALMMKRLVSEKVLCS
jgi:hypothetical protein